MDRLYSYSDYENAYYHMQYHRCIEIGKYLLSFIHNDRARELSEKLSKANYRWDMPQWEAEEFSKLMWEVKVWIMVHENY